MTLCLRRAGIFRSSFLAVLSGAITTACSISIEDGPQNDDGSAGSAESSQAEARSKAVLLVSLAFNGLEFQPTAGETLSIGLLATESKGSGEKARFLTFEGQKGPYTLEPSAAGTYSVVVHVQRSQTDALPLTGEVPVSFSADKSQEISVTLSENDALVGISKPAEPYPEPPAIPERLEGDQASMAAEPIGPDQETTAVGRAEAAATDFQSESAADTEQTQSSGSVASSEDPDQPAVREESAPDRAEARGEAPGESASQPADVCHPSPMVFFYAPGEQPKTAYNSCTETELVKKGYLSLELMIEGSARRAAGGEICVRVTTIVRHNQTGEAAELASSCEVDTAQRHGFTVLANL